VRIGILIDSRGAASIDDVIGQARQVAANRLAGAWLGETGTGDPLTTLALAGREVPGLELGTAVVRTHPRHPLQLAEQALTVQAATGNRLALGVGVGHRSVVEGELGYRWEKPARHLREYLSALLPLLRGEQVSYQGETRRAVGSVAVAGAKAPSVLVSAHGPLMLQVAGELADGAMIAWAGTGALADHVVPALTRAAAAAGRPRPRVVAELPVSVTCDEEGVRRQTAALFAGARDQPSYRATLEQQGAAGPEDVMVIGDEAAVERSLARLADAGATDLLAFPVGSRDDRGRTLALLARLAESVPGTHAS
jgi:F420-dependent oxidoreductase-like protein